MNWVTVINAMDAVSAELDTQRHVTLQARSDGNGIIEVSVSDLGPGVTPERLAKRLEPFYTTKPNGMGLGLRISRTIIEAHGGQIWAENHADRGTKFRFTLCAAEAGGNG